MSEEERILSELVERELSSVEFVRGYVQLRFDGPCLSLLSLPAVFTDGHAVGDKGQAYLERIVGLVGSKVIEVRFRAQTELVLVFEGGVTVRAALDKGSRKRPGEAVTFDLNDPEHRSFVA